MGVVDLWLGEVTLRSVQFTWQCISWFEPQLFTYHHIISYCIFLRRQFKNTCATAIKQTGKFSAVLQMFPGTVSGHECRLASCSRRVGRRRQMICHIVQFLSAEHRASRYQLITCQDDGCRPGDSTQLNTLVHVQWDTYAPVLQVCK